MTQASTEQLNRLAKLVDSGKIKPQIYESFTLEHVKEAFEFFEQEHPKGRL